MPLNLSPPPIECLSIFCCPRCGSQSLEWARPALLSQSQDADAVVATCTGCGHGFPVKRGILDLLVEGDETEIITPFQRLMQLPPVAAVYERYWRPLGFFLASSASFRNFSKGLLEWVDPAQRQLILDLACGPGLFTCPLASRTSGWVIGFDLSLPMLQRARAKANAQGLANVLLVRGSAFRLPFRQGCFDAILCSGALHLFHQPETALREIARTLAPRSRFVCQTTLRPRHSAGLASFLDQVIRFGFFQSPEELHEKLRDAGIMVDDAWSRRIIHVIRGHRP